MINEKDSHKLGLCEFSNGLQTRVGFALHKGLACVELNPLEAEKEQLGILNWPRDGMTILPGPFRRFCRYFDPFKEDYIVKRI